MSAESGGPIAEKDVACKCSTGCPNDLSGAEIALGLSLCGLCMGEGCTPVTSPGGSDA